jgi:hypothetical protein
MARLSDKKAFTKCIEAINQEGALLVYPVNNKPQPDSLWAHLHPKTEMVWDWNEDGGDQVAQLWHIRTQLSESNEVIYSKWHQGRATFFSKPAFVDFLAYMRSLEFEPSPQQRDLMDMLTADSPQSTKQIKAGLELEGRLNEPTYNRLLKPLWNRLWLVGYGEFEDSSFPSLGIGAAQTLFEDLWAKAAETDPAQAEKRLKRKFESSPFLKWATRIRNESLDKAERQSYI